MTARPLLWLVGISVVFFHHRPLAASGAESLDPYAGLRPATRQYIAAGTPGDLVRLRQAFDRTEQEIARLKLDAVPEHDDILAEKRRALGEVRHQLAESEALLELLGRATADRPKKGRDTSSGGQRETLQRALARRRDDLKQRVARLEQEIRHGETEHLRRLEEEHRALARLLILRREQLLAEYQSLSSCARDDGTCLSRKLTILCRLAPLFPGADGTPLLPLLDEVTARLDLRVEEATHGPTVGHGTSSALCEYLRRELATK